MIIGMVRGEETVDVKVESIIFDIKQLTRRLEQVCFSFTKWWGNRADHEPIPLRLVGKMENKKLEKRLTTKGKYMTSEYSNSLDLGK
ncbi:hypothetical protein GBA52_003589 [Prunus armeniaca]|nr:hypothetical protein GBA52_003589 [Prunus armeniaca]